MLNIGNYNTLRIIKILSFGAYLDGGDGNYPVCAGWG